MVFVVYTCNCSSETAAHRFSKIAGLYARAFMLFPWDIKLSEEVKAVILVWPVSSHPFFDYIFN